MNRYTFEYETKCYVLESLDTNGYTLFLVVEEDFLYFVHHFDTFCDFLTQYQSVLQDFAECNFEWPFEDF